MSESCRQDRRRYFNVYDQAVDIVSCWEAFGEFSYGGIFDTFYFDRFPSISTDDQSDLTPDFTICFDDSYGIIGEIKRTFPNNTDAFKNTLSQLEKYDGTHSIKSSSSKELEPETCDILLLISGSDAPQIGTRIFEFRSENVFNFESNLVVLRYQYNTSDVVSRYEFQRVTQVEDEFRDEVLPIPDEKRLSNELGEAGNYGTMKVYPKHFTPQKVETPICNDKPPESYLATILWHKILPEYLTGQEFYEWRSGSAQKTMQLEKSPDEITNKLNQEYVQNGQIRRRWIVDALDFLEGANLATETANGYNIKFRGLVREVGESNHQEGTQDLDQIRELATTFIDRYCEYQGDNSEDDPAQSSFDEF